jgi:hypothetical protein
MSHKGAEAQREAFRGMKSMGGATGLAAKGRSEEAKRAQAGAYAFSSRAREREKKAPEKKSGRVVWRCVMR